MTQRMQLINRTEYTIYQKQPISDSFEGLQIGYSSWGLILIVNPKDKTNNFVVTTSFEALTLFFSNKIKLYDLLLLFINRFAAIEQNDFKLKRLSLSETLEMLINMKLPFVYYKDVAEKCYSDIMNKIRQPYDEIFGSMRAHNRDEYIFATENIISELEFMKYKGIDLSDIGNSVGIALRTVLKDCNNIGEVYDFNMGFNHGFSHNEQPEHTKNSKP